MNIKNFVSLTAGGLLVSTCSALSFIALNNAKQSTNESIDQSINNTIAFANTTIMEWELPKRNWIKATQEALGKKTYSPEEILNILQIAEGTLGVEYAYVGLKDCTMVAPSADLAGYYPCDKDWYKKALLNGSYENDIYFDKDVNMGLYSISKRIDSTQGKPIGVVAVDISANTLDAILGSLDLPNGYKAFFFDKSGNVIAGTSGEKYMDFTVETRFPSLDKSINELGKSGVLRNESTHEQVKVAPINNGKLFIAIAVSEDVALASYNETKKMLILLSAIIALAAMGSLYLAVNRKMKRLDHVNEQLEDISSGNADLTKRMDDKGDDEVSNLAKNYNAFANKMNSLIASVKDGANKIGSASVISAEATTETNSKLESQNDAIIQVAAAITEMASATSEITSHAENAARSTEICSETTAQGDAMFTELDKEIRNLLNSIVDSSDKIDSLSVQTNAITVIVERIRDIAEQTNLLALNAAIEAARAGEAGRGFAVVADEVRLLSDRTRESTSEIESMVRSLQTETSDAVSSMQQSVQLADKSSQLTEEAKGKLSDIKNTVSEIADMTIQISAACEQQAVAAEEISQNTNSIQAISNDILEQAMIAQESSEETNKTAVHVNELVKEFVTE